MEQEQLLRALPKVDTLITDAAALGGEEGFSQTALLSAARAVAEALRARVLAGRLDRMPAAGELAGMVLEEARRQARYRLRPVINATGVVLHTNLGRAPLGEAVAEHVRQVALGYCTLEYDVESGGRGSRHAVVEDLLCRLSGAGAAMVVNNNAAAVLLALAAGCQGREVPVSRGELVEIGGSFRVPQVMEQSGAVLCEVGTTNKTRLSDYEDAIRPGDTGGLLKVHTSNFRVVGFTEEVPAKELAGLAHRHGLPLLYDLGSGAFGLPGLPAMADEPTVTQAVASGADVITFSGDKLLGGPQAGIVLGSPAIIGAMKRHPLARALRIDKLSLAALEATLRLYEDPQRAAAQIPVLAFAALGQEELRERAQRLAEKLTRATGACTFTVREMESQVGGGSMPGQGLPSYGVAVTAAPMAPQALDAALRQGEVPVIGRVSHGCYMMDVRTIPPAKFELAAQAFGAVFAAQ